MAGLGTEEPDVTVHSNRSVTISLRDNLMGKYMCYCAEWTERGREAAFASYYSLHNSRTLTLKGEGQRSAQGFQELTAGPGSVEAE